MGAARTKPGDSLDAGIKAVWSRRPDKPVGGEGDDGAGLGGAESGHRHVGLDRDRFGRRQYAACGWLPGRGLEVPRQGEWERERGGARGKGRSL